MSQENENEADKPTLTENFLSSDGAPCSVSSLLEWLDENACELVAETCPIADTGDYDGAWVVYQHEGYPGGTPKRIAMGWGRTPASAIEDAQRGPEDPEKMDYVPPDCRIEYAPTVEEERTKRAARDAPKKVPDDQVADAVIWTEAYLEWLRVRVRGLGQNV
jgi:hypothetical protein